jgi:hypothetical protein
MPEETIPPPEAGTDSNYKTIAEFISDSKLMLNNSKANSLILAKMIAAGYPEATIDAQLSQLDNLALLNETQAAEYGEQYEATKAWYDAKDAIHPDYIDHVELARIVFKKDVSAQAALDLSGRRKKGQADYAAQALQFYNNALDKVPFKTALATKGITQTVLQNQQTAFANLQALREAQQQEVGEAQIATKDRDVVYDALAEWMMDYRDTAKVVLRTAPQLMEEIGIKDPS